MFMILQEAEDDELEIDSEDPLADNDTETDSDTNSDDAAEDDNEEPSEEEESKVIESEFFDKQKNDLLFQNYYDTLDQVENLINSINSIYDSTAFTSDTKTKLYSTANNMGELKLKLEKIIKNFSKITYVRKEVILELSNKSLTSASEEINTLIDSSEKQST